MELKPLNFELMKQPLNWVIVTVMFLIASLFVELIMQYLNIKVGGANGNISSTISK